MVKVRITAPAKINLGLEILGRRDDGYHEIVTVMAMVDLCDVIELSLSSAGAGMTRVNAVRGVSEGEDLTVRALDLIAREAGCRQPGARINLEKHIPVAAGLGGASSDAAATLVAAHHLWERPIDQAQLHHDAAALGSDVPFFLGEPCALATGTGTDLEPLPAPRGWLAIATPPHELADKTRRMYGALRSTDYSDGERVRRVAQALRAGEVPVTTDLHNAFARPLYELAPDLARIPRVMQQFGAACVALSGAGPSHYAWFQHAAEARAALGELASLLPEQTQLHVAPFSRLQLGDRLTISLT